MRHLLLISDVLSRVCLAVGKTASWLFFALMAVIVYDVVMRRFFVVGSIRLQELEWHLHATLFMLCLGYGYLSNAHVRIQLLREHFGDKVQLLLEIVGILLLLLPLCWVLIDYSSDLVRRSYVANERSPHASGLPYRWAIKALLPIGFGLLFASAVSVLLRATVLLFGSAELKARAADPMLISTPTEDSPVYSKDDQRR